MTPQRLISCSYKGPLRGHLRGVRGHQDAEQIQTLPGTVVPRIFARIVVDGLQYCIFTQTIYIDWNPTATILFSRGQIIAKCTPQQYCQVGDLLAIFVEYEGTKNLKPEMAVVLKNYQKTLYLKINLEHGT